VIDVRCSDCQHEFEVSDALTGRSAQCENCGAMIRVPEEALPVLEMPASPTRKARVLLTQCPFCQTAKASVVQHSTTPVTRVLELVVILGGASLFLLGVMNPTRNLVVGSALIGVGILTMVGGVVAIRFLFSSAKHVCPDCKQIIRG
jgi:Zn finger protein HypA/HybF involved in hydrogenase expression